MSTQHCTEQRGAASRIPAYEYRFHRRWPTLCTPELLIPLLDQRTLYHFSLPAIQRPDLGQLFIREGGSDQSAKIFYQVMAVAGTGV